jgi:hypothetical protein
MDKRDKTHINIMNSLNKDGGNSVTDIDIGFTEKYRIFCCYQMFNKFISLLLLLFLLPSIQTLNPICSLCHEIFKAIQHSIPLTPPVFLADAIGTTFCAKKHLQ